MDVDFGTPGQAPPPPPPPYSHLLFLPEAITIETDKPCPPEEAKALLADAPGCVLNDDTKANKYPMPLTAQTKYACRENLTPFFFPRPPPLPPLPSLSLFLFLLLSSRSARS